jgi:hypothetical protein
MHRNAMALRGLLRGEEGAYPRYRGLVLWGKRRGDVQYNSREFWRRNIPIGAERLPVARALHFDVGAIIAVGNESLRVVGIEDDVLGIARRKA